MSLSGLMPVVDALTILHGYQVEIVALCLNV